MIAFVGIFYLISLILTKKSKAVIANMGLAFIMLILSLIMNGMMMYDNNFIIQFIFDLNPYGQLAQLTAMKSANLLRCIVIDIAVFIILIMCGVRYFKKKDIMG